MSKVVENAEATPATGKEPGTFRDFISLKTAKPSEPAVPAKGEENQPEPAPGKTVETVDPEKKAEPKQLTPEERSERDRARDARKWEKLNRELSETRRELEELRKPKAEAAPAAKSEGKPKLEDFTSQIGEGKKYKFYEEAHEAYEDARDTWREKEVRAKFEQERAAEGRHKELDDFHKTIKKHVAGNEDFQDVYDSVIDSVSESLGDKNHVSTALVRCEHPVEVIQYLHDHPTVFDKLIEMTPARAVMQIGAISSRFDKEESPKKPEPVEDAPRSTQTVRARGEGPNHLQAMNKASNLNQFREQKRAAQKAGVKY